MLEVLVAGDALPFQPDVRRDLRRRAARIALDPLGDDDRAIPLYGSLFDDDPHDAEAVEKLAATYAKHGRARDCSPSGNGRLGRPRTRPRASSFA